MLTLWSRATNARQRTWRDTTRPTGNPPVPLVSGLCSKLIDFLQEIPFAVYRESCTHKFDRGLSRLLHTELHWLDIPERVTYKLGVIMFGCQHGRASPQYLMDYCLPVSDVASRQHLRSASRRLLVVSRHRLITYFCSQRTSAISALDVSRRCAL